jgi:hypothetical protein
MDATAVAGAASAAIRKSSKSSGAIWNYTVTVIGYVGESELRERLQRLDKRPFLIGEIARIAQLGHGHSGGGSRWSASGTSRIDAA